MRLIFSRRLPVIALGFTLLAMVLALYLRPRPRLNVIFLTLDTVRSDHLGCYGCAFAETPAIDELAQQGVLFQRAYTPVPLTLPAHASLLTGCNPPVHGLFLNGRGRLGNAIPVLSEILQKRGYDTAAFVASYVLNSKFGLKRGFQRYDDEPVWTEVPEPSRYPRRDGAAVMSSAIDWLRGRNSRPFFCWIHLYDAHADPESHYDTRERLFGDQFRERPYDAGIAYVDRQVAELQQFLQNEKMAERTILVLVGDHGEGLMEHAEREHGYLLYDSTIRVPLIVAGPTFVQRGHQVPQLVSLVDLMPTVLDCLNIKQSSPTCGRSLRATLSGRSIATQSCYAGTDAPFEFSGWAPLRAVVNDRWKYIETSRPELYDLAQDPQELHDLAAEQPERRQELADALHSLQQQMSRRAVSTSEVQLTSKERRKLESLGYAGVSSRPSFETAQGELLPDVKDMIPLYNDLHEQVAEARRFLANKEPEEAIRTLSAVLDKVPEYLEARLLTAKALLQLQQVSEAIPLLERLLADQPDRAETHVLLGQALAAQHQWLRAVSHFRFAIRIDPSPADVHFNLAQALSQLGKEADAVAELKEAVRRDPQHAAAKAELDRLMQNNEATPP
ncbi:MAG: sulfatase-like hydrolase/transferase [Planctomycetaceae bacterium]